VSYHTEKAANIQRQRAEVCDVEQVKCLSPEGEF